MRSRTRRAVAGRTCQTGRSVSITSALVTSETGSCANAREREPRHARHPILAVLRIAPAGLHLGPDLLGGGGEGRRALETALLGERVATGAGELAVGEGERAGLLERDEREAAEPEFAAASADGDPLDPTPAAGRLDVEVQALAVAIPAGRGDGADEGGREGVFGLARGGVSRQHPFHQSFNRYVVERSGCYRSLWLVSSQDTLY